MASAKPASAAGAPHGPPPGPPYASPVWQYGEVPIIIPDAPLCAVYLAGYVAAAITHMAIFKLNKKQGHLFFMSAMTFGFCMCRLVTFSLRLAWSIHQRNVSLGIASNIFVAAGTPILYIINLIFAHRIIRAQHPRLGWHRSLSLLARLTVIAIVLTLILLIYSAIQASYTLNVNIHRIVRDIQLYGTTFYTVIAFFPIPMILLGLVLPRRIRAEKFGIGRFRTKIFVLTTSTLLLTLRAVWGTTATWLTPIPRTAPRPWYYSKAAFYTVQLLTELVVVYLYAFVRVDRRFYTPTGQRGSYATLPGPDSSMAHLRVPTPQYCTHNVPTTSTMRVYSEEELFDDSKTLADTLRYSSTSLMLDSASGRWELKRHSVSSLYPPSQRTGHDGRSSYDVKSHYDGRSTHDGRSNYHGRSSDVGSSTPSKLSVHF